jgi:hypothetical protein
MYAMAAEDWNGGLSCVQKYTPAPSVMTRALEEFRGAISC